MKRSALVVLCLILAASYAAAQPKQLDSREECLRVCDEFMKRFVAGRIEKGFEVLKPYSVIPEKEFTEAVSQSVNQLGLIGNRIGKIVGYQLVGEETVKDTIVKYTFIAKYEKHVIRCIFMFYRPGEKWIFNRFNFDDNVDELFR